MHHLWYTHAFDSSITTQINIHVWYIHACLQIHICIHTDTYLHFTDIIVYIHMYTHIHKRLHIHAYTPISSESATEIPLSSCFLFGSELLQTQNLRQVMITCVQPHACANTRLLETTRLYDWFMLAFSCQTEQTVTEK